MTAKRYTIKPQDNLFGVVDNYSADKVCVINGIRTEIEAKWLCKDMNTLNDENEQLKQRNDRQAKQLDRLYSLIEEKDWTALSDIVDDFKRYEEQLQKEWRIYDESE